MLWRLRPIRKVAIRPPAKSHKSNPITRLAGRRRPSSGLERRSTVATWHPRCRDDRSVSHPPPTIIAIRVTFSWCCHCRVGSQVHSARPWRVRGSSDIARSDHNLDLLPIDVHQLLLGPCRHHARTGQLPIEQRNVAPTPPARSRRCSAFGKSVYGKIRVASISRIYRTTPSVNHIHVVGVPAVLDVASVSLLTRNGSITPHFLWHPRTPPYPVCRAKCADSVRAL